MAFFVVMPFNGKCHFHVEIDPTWNKDRKSNGEPRWPVPLEVVPISDELAKMPMDVLIGLYLIHSQRIEKMKTSRIPTIKQLMETVVCPSCHGRGGDGAAAMICVTCGGKRTIERVMLHDGAISNQRATNTD